MPLLGLATLAIAVAALLLAGSSAPGANAQSDDAIADCVPERLIATVQRYYELNAARGGKSGANWKRVLIAFGDVQDENLTPFTAAEARVSETRWGGWRPIRVALECIEAAPAAQPTAIPTAPTATPTPAPAPTATPTPAPAPTATPTPAPAPTATPTLTPAPTPTACVPSTLLSTVRYYYQANQDRAPHYGENWKRVLIAFGDVQDGNLTPFTAAEAQANEQRWGGWRPIRTALECIESAADAQQAPAQPTATPTPRTCADADACAHRDAYAYAYGDTHPHRNARVTAAAATGGSPRKRRRSRSKRPEPSPTSRREPRFRKASTFGFGSARRRSTTASTNRLIG